MKSFWVSFKLTKQSMKQLRHEGVPEKIVEAMKPLKIVADIRNAGKAEPQFDFANGIFRVILPRTEADAIQDFVSASL